MTSSERDSGAAKRTVNISSDQKTERTVKNKDLMIRDNQLNQFLNDLAAEHECISAIMDFASKFDGCEDDQKTVCSLEHIYSSNH